MKDVENVTGSMGEGVAVTPAAAHPWIERDPATGGQSLKLPLPPPETARQLANALSALADSLRGRMA
jgi:hypothetical protein